MPKRSRIDIVLKQLEGKKKTIENFLNALLTTTVYPDGSCIEEEEAFDWIDSDHIPDYTVEENLRLSYMTVFEAGLELGQRAGRNPIYRWDRGDHVCFFIESEARYNEIVAKAREFFDSEPEFDSEYE